MESTRHLCASTPETLHEGFSFWNEPMTGRSSTFRAKLCETSPRRCASPRIRVRVPSRTTGTRTSQIRPHLRSRTTSPRDRSREEERSEGGAGCSRSGRNKAVPRKEIKKGERKRKREAEKRTDNCQHKGGEGSSLLFTRRSSARDSISHASASSFSDILVFYVIYIVRGALGRVWQGKSGNPEIQKIMQFCEQVD